MQDRKFILMVGALATGSLASAQQAGTIAADRPNGVTRLGIKVTRVNPKPTCETTSAAAGGELNSVPEMLFGRSWDDLVCVRHKDGRTELFRSDMPAGVASPDGSAIAYWNREKQEMYVFLTENSSNVLVESLPGASLRDMAWSAKGHLLTYFPTKASPPGVRSYDVDTAKRVVLDGSYVAVVAPPDAEHVVAVSAEGIKTLSLQDGTSETTASVQYAESAQYSRWGRYLGIVGNMSVAEQNTPPATAASSPSEDDGPDCTGGSFALILQDAKTKKLVDVPYPKGFDTVLDFAFSPDESAVAVTFGVTGCDYPGDRAQIFYVTLPDLKSTAITPEDRLSVKPVWTPDGRTIVYSDYSGSNSPLVAIDLASRKVVKITTPGQFGPDNWLGWR